MEFSFLLFAQRAVFTVLCTLVCLMLQAKTHSPFSLNYFSHYSHGLCFINFGKFTQKVTLVLVTISSAMCSLYPLAQWFSKGGWEDMGDGWGKRNQGGIRANWTKNLGDAWDMTRGSSQKSLRTTGDKPQINRNLT